MGCGEKDSSEVRPAILRVPPLPRTPTRRIKRRTAGPAARQPIMEPTIYPETSEGSAMNMVSPVAEAQLQPARRPPAMWSI
jgi:hypothetical protein